MPRASWRCRSCHFGRCGRFSPVVGSVHCVFIPVWVLLSTPGIAALLRSSSTQRTHPNQVLHCLCFVSCSSSEVLLAFISVLIDHQEMRIHIVVKEFRYKVLTGQRLWRSYLYVLAAASCPLRLSQQRISVLNALLSHLCVHCFRRPAETFPRRHSALCDVSN